MSKKKGQNTVSNYQRQVAERQPALIDRLAGWIGARSRLVRTLLAAAIALAITVAMALMLYGSLFNINPNQLHFGPIDASNLPFVAIVILSVAGIACYWVGWRVLIGFDTDEAPLIPGRPAAWWVLIGVLVLALITVAMFLTAYNVAQN